MKMPDYQGNLNEVKGNILSSMYLRVILLMSSSIYLCVWIMFLQISIASSGAAAMTLTSSSSNGNMKYNICMYETFVEMRTGLGSYSSTNSTKYLDWNILLTEIYLNK